MAATVPGRAALATNVIEALVVASPTLTAALGAAAHFLVIDGAWHRHQMRRRR